MSSPCIQIFNILRQNNIDFFFLYSEQLKSGLSVTIIHFNSFFWQISVSYINISQALRINASEKYLLSSFTASLCFINSLEHELNSAMIVSWFMWFQPWFHSSLDSNEFVDEIKFKYFCIHYLNKMKLFFLQTLSQMFFSVFKTLIHCHKKLDKIQFNCIILVFKCLIFKK